MSYTVLARKYRPQTFDDLVGQEHVARTLGNAIETDRVAHAFLFTGVRGVGKTTSARLLAKALNCEKGPTPRPCNACSPCMEITQGIDLDVLEMDGASNNSVEDVRRLQESIPYRPTRDRFKVVIVDEVHMLSTGAFNAFLKTLEEPPPHVKFIFATTESHKVPITIRSRCQRYDFRLIPQGLIADRSRQILEAEGIQADDGVFSIVAREAAGSMRDALTLLDQIVAFGGSDLRGATVAKTLGIAAREHVHEITQAVLQGNAATVLRSVDELAARGIDMLHFAKQLLDYARELVVLEVAKEDADSLVSLVEEEKQQAKELASSTDVLELQRVFSSLSLLVEDVGRSGTPRTVLEMGLVRLATRPPLKQVSELLARLDALEARLSGGPPPSGGGRRQATGPRPDGSEPGRAARGDTKTSPPPTTPSASSRQENPADSEPVTPTPAPLAADQGSAEAKAERPEQPTSDKPKVVQEAPAGGDQAMVSVWARIIASLRDARPALAAVLEHGTPQHVDRERIVIAFPDGSFFGQQASTEESREGLAAGAAQVVGARPEIDIRVSKESQGSGPTMAELEAKRRDDRRTNADRKH